MVGEVKLSIKVEVSDEMVERLVDLVIKRIAALQERQIEYIGLSDEQKAVLAEGLSKLSAEGYPYDVIGKQNHVFNK